MKRITAFAFALFFLLTLFSGCASDDRIAALSSDADALRAEFSDINAELARLSEEKDRLSAENTRLSDTLKALSEENAVLASRDAELSEKILASSVDTILAPSDPVIEPIFLQNSMTTRSGIKYIIPETNTCSVLFNVKPDTSYSVTVSGPHDRFRFYGRKSVDSEGFYLSDERIDGVIADHTTDAEIDSKDTYVIQSGEYRTVILYLSGKQYLEGKTTVSITQLDNFGYEIDPSLLPRNETPIYNDIFVPWIPEKVSHGTEWADMTSEQFVEAAYEPLRRRYPTYISREVIGMDQTGKYKIYAYTFEPDYYEQTIYLQSGVHPYEIDGWMGLALLMDQICNNWQSNDGLAYLRWGCKIVVVPVVNVWGVSQPRSERTLKTSTGLNLNRDTLDKTQAETKAVTALIDRLAPELAFAIDFHTTVNNSYGDYMLTAYTGSPSERIAKRTGMMLARKNAHERMPEYLAKYGLKMDELRLPYFGDSLYTGTYAMYFRESGIPGGTIEHSDYVWDNALATYTTLTKALEAFGNQTIQHAINKLYLKK